MKVSNDDKDLMQALKRIKKARAKKLQAPFPKHFTRNYPRPPVSNHFSRRHNNKSRFNNGHNAYNISTGNSNSNRPGRHLNQPSSTKSGLSLIANTVQPNNNHKKLSSVIPPSTTAHALKNNETSNNMEGDGEHGPKTINVVDANTKKSSRQISIETRDRRWKRHGRPTTQHPIIYQLPPNKPAFVPTEEPWRKSVYGDVGDDEIAKSLDGSVNDTGSTQQYKLAYGEPW